MVDVGDVAPDFTLPGATGEWMTLSELQGEKRALLIFYPQDNTSGWRNQLSAVGATIDDFRALDTEPYGVNPGSAESHRDFIEKLKLPFDLLVDEDLDVATVYGTVRPEGDKNARTVIMVGKDGVVFFRAAGAPDPSDLLQAIREARDWRIEEWSTPR